MGTFVNLAARVLAPAILGFGLLAAPAHAGLPPGDSRPGDTHLVSVASDGSPALLLDSTVTKAGQNVDMTPDGRFVTFDSTAVTLVPGDTNDKADVFVHDRETGTTERVSLSSDGQQSTDGHNGYGASAQPSISADGRYVVFSSYARLVPGDTNSTIDIYLRDRLAGTTRRLSETPSGAGMNGYTTFPMISDDGSTITFGGATSNLVPGDMNGKVDIFAVDRVTGTTEIVSVSSAGGQGDDDSSFSVPSADGRYIVFRSWASNLVAGQHRTINLFVRDRLKGTTELVSAPLDGSAPSSSADSGSISADGRFVAFMSNAANLVPGDTNGKGDIFLTDRVLGTMQRISLSSAGVESNGTSFTPYISPDGRFVSFMSNATNLVPGDGNGSYDIFMRDLELRTTERVSVSSDGHEGVGSSYSNTPPSAGGRFVAFYGDPPALVQDDHNSASDVFVHDAGVGQGAQALAAEAMADGSVRASGWVSMRGAELAAATDPADDGGEGALEVGAELTGASIRYRTGEDDLHFGLDLAALPKLPVPSNGILPGQGGAGLPGVVHGVRFSVLAGTAGSSVSARVPWEVRVVRAGTGTAALPRAVLVRCDNLFGTCSTVRDLPVGLGAAGRAVEFSVPLSAVNLAIGHTAQGVQAFTSWGDEQTGSRVVLDEIDLGDVTPPVQSVWLGTSPDQTVEPTGFARASAGGGSFTGTAPSSGGTAGAVHVRACLGSECVTWSRPLG